MGCFWLLGKRTKRRSLQKLAPTAPPFLGPAFHWTVRCVSSSRCEHLWTWCGTVSTQSFTFRHREGSVQVTTGLQRLEHLHANVQGGGGVVSFQSGALVARWEMHLWYLVLILPATSRLSWQFRNISRLPFLALSNSSALASHNLLLIIISHTQNPKFVLFTSNRGAGESDLHRHLLQCIRPPNLVTGCQLQLMVKGRPQLVAEVNQVSLHAVRQELHRTAMSRHEASMCGQLNDGSAQTRSSFRLADLPDMGSSFGCPSVIVVWVRPVEGHQLRHMGWGGERRHSFQLPTRDCCLVSFHHVQQPVQGPLVRQQLDCVYHQRVTLPLHIL